MWDSIILLSPCLAEGKPLWDRVCCLTDKPSVSASIKNCCWVSALLKTSNLSQNHSPSIIKLVGEKAGLLVDCVLSTLSITFLPANLPHPVVLSAPVLSFIFSFSELLVRLCRSPSKHLIMYKAGGALQMRSCISYQNSIIFYSLYLIVACGLVL